MLDRLLNPMAESKQIIGRWTRFRDGYRKLSFNLNTLDSTVTAPSKFADPVFDGDPTLAAREQISVSSLTGRHFWRTSSD